MVRAIGKKAVRGMQKTTAVEPVVSSEDMASDELSLNDRLLIGLSMASRYIALAAAWVAMCGSLFMSDVLGWPPCILCWYQRIALYPLSLLIALGILRRDKQLHLYVLPIATIGACISIYHYAITKRLLPPPPCTSGIPCENGWINWLGFINVPFLALIAFIIIIFMMLVSSSVIVEDGEDVGEEGAANARPRFGPIVPVAAIIVLVVGSFFTAAMLR